MSEDDVRRAVLRMRSADFTRLRLLMVAENMTWQMLLTEAVNDWLRQHAHKELDSL